MAAQDEPANPGSAPGPTPGTEVDLPAARQALQRLLASATFERAHRLREFLAYIAERTLRGDGATINETLIGMEVFGRGPTFSPGEDAIVRRQAHALRGKLLQYYAGEGAGEVVQIDLPAGAYVPTFRLRGRALAEAAPAPVSTPPPARARLALLAGGGALLFGGGVLVGTRLDRRVATPTLDPALAELWSAWGADRGPVTLCFSNPMTATIRHDQDPEPPSGKRGLALVPGSEEDRRFRSYFGLPDGGWLYVSPDDGQGKVGEGQGGVRLATFFARLNRPVRTTQSRFLTWDRLRQESVVLFGHPEINPWSDRLLETRPFRLRPNLTGEGRRIVDTRTGGAAWENRRAEDPKGVDEHFALVSFLPGVAAQRTLLVVSGLSSPASDLAAELLTDGDAASRLLTRLRASAPAGRAPWHFQAVVRAHVRQDVPIRAEFVALAVL